MTPTYGVPAATKWSSTGCTNCATSSSAEYGTGAGAYAPIPPVLGPVSPSPMRLWSCASGSGRATWPSHSASSEHSGPVIRSSSTNGPSAARIAASVSASSTGTVTPLPAWSPSSLTTTGRPSSRHQARAASTSPPANVAKAGPGMPSDVASSRAQPFDASSRARSADGPKQGMSRSAQRVGDAGDERGLGPGDHEVGFVAGEVVDVPEQRHLVAVAAAGPGDRLLPPAGADDGDPHRARLRGFRAPTPRTKPSTDSKHSGERARLMRARPRKPAWPGPRRPRGGSGR